MALKGRRRRDPRLEDFRSGQGLRHERFETARAVQGEEPVDRRPHGDGTGLDRLFVGGGVGEVAIAFFTSTLD